MSAESSQVRHNCVTREFFKRRSRERHTDMYNNSWWHKTSSATNRYHSTRYVQMSWQAGMLTRPEIDEAKAEANSHEAEAKSALIFSAKFYILTQFFVQKKTQIFRQFSTAIQKVRLKTGFNLGTSYAFWRRLLLLCLHTE